MVISKGPINTDTFKLLHKCIYVRGEKQIIDKHFNYTHTLLLEWKD